MVLTDEQGQEIPWDAATIEQCLRNGAHIYDDGFQDSNDFSAYNQESHKFEHVYYSVDADQEGIVRPPLGTEHIKEFDTFLELAAWLAFMGRTYL
jgi:hypothetical protein